MKKSIGFSFVALITLFMFFACSSGGSSPTATAKEYADYMQASEYDKILDLCAIDESLPKAEIKMGKLFISNILSSLGDQYIKRKGGLKDTKILSETISEDGKTATVKIEQTYGNGESENTTLDMVLKKGKWKLKFL